MKSFKPRNLNGPTFLLSSKSHCLTRTCTQTHIKACLSIISIRQTVSKTDLIPKDHVSKDNDNATSLRRIQFFSITRIDGLVQNATRSLIASLFALRSNAIQRGEAALKKQALWYRDRKFATALKLIFFRRPREATSCFFCARAKV